MEKYLSAKNLDITFLLVYKAMLNVSNYVLPKCSSRRTVCNWFCNIYSLSKIITYLATLNRFKNMFLSHIKKTLNYVILAMLQLSTLLSFAL